ncbi:hypothetical protein JWJ90_00825 [Desulfobulbus rhabdoformis]|uniref:hypothetical protein n=1 Tax=Desulfobulbus rhabdoformis TaxID=34032 RepID=UPI001965F04C|nr:hypothetical protein [Desulfobulbus rhabdoformis]MBM9612823.1 hypothetical protein [Desulfobulbus rhabdoformis]
MVVPLQTGTSMVGVLGIASAMSVGSNWVDVRRGALTPGQAVVNGLAKGVAATLIIQATSRSTPLQVALAASVLAGAGYLIDATMKKSKDELCQVEVQGEK